MKWDEYIEKLKVARGILIKRLSDAELAAEYHAWHQLCRREQWIEACRGEDYTRSERAGQDRMYERLTTIYRLATLPHHDARPAH